MELSLRLHPPAQHQVAADAEDDKEDAEDDEVEVELSVLHVKLLQNIGGLREDALLLTAVQLPAVATVNGLQDALERVPDRAYIVCQPLFRGWGTPGERLSR